MLQTHCVFVAIRIGSDFNKSLNSFSKQFELEKKVFLRAKFCYIVRSIDFNVSEEKKLRPFLAFIFTFNNGASVTINYYPWENILTLWHYLKFDYFKLQIILA